MEDAISNVLVGPIRHVYALLWRFGLLITDQGTSNRDEFSERIPGGVRR